MVHTIEEPEEEVSPYTNLKALFENQELIMNVLSDELNINWEEEVWKKICMDLFDSLDRDDIEIGYNHQYDAMIRKEDIYLNELESAMDKVQEYPNVLMDVSSHNIYFDF